LKKPIKPINPHLAVLYMQERAEQLAEKADDLCRKINGMGEQQLTVPELLRLLNIIDDIFSRGADIKNRINLIELSLLVEENGKSTSDIEGESDEDQK